MNINPSDLDTMVPIFKNAVTQAGWTMDDSPNLSSDAAWKSITEKYIKWTDPRTGSISQAVERFINDLEDEEHGKKSIRFSIIPGMNLVLHEDTDGSLVTDWLSPTTRLRLKKYNYGENNEKVTVGPVRTYTGFYPDWHDFEKYAFSYQTEFYTGLYVSRIWDGDILVPISYPFYYGSAEAISYEMVAWRIKISTIGGEGAGAEYMNHLVYRDKKATWAESPWVTHELDYFGTAFVNGYLPMEERDVETITFSPSLPPSGGIRRHIGDEIKNVSSITGGNGADAIIPNATRNEIGQGGNGGHGGGGAGAGGFCKQEVVRQNGNVEIDITQKIGTMTPGISGHGSRGTAGKNGGCIIYY